MDSLLGLAILESVKFIGGKLVVFVNILTIVDHVDVDLDVTSAFLRDVEEGAKSSSDGAILVKEEFIKAESFDFHIANFIDFEAVEGRHLRYGVSIGSIVGQCSLVRNIFSVCYNCGHFETIGRLSSNEI